MKKLFCLLIVVFSIGKISFSQQVKFQYCKYINGFWNEWSDEYSCVIKGRFDDFIIYNKHDHPSKYIMRIKIYYFSEEKKAKKLRLKNGWYEYDGIVEYFTTDYDSQHQNFKFESWPHFQLDAQGGSIIDKEYVKVNQRQAKIGIQAYKGKQPRCFNIFFDNIGIGLTIK